MFAYVVSDSSFVVIGLGKWIEWEMFIFFPNHLVVTAVVLWRFYVPLWRYSGCRWGGGLYIPVTSLSGGGPMAVSRILALIRRLR